MTAPRKDGLSSKYITGSSSSAWPDRRIGLESGEAGVAEEGCYDRVSRGGGLTPDGGDKGEGLHGVSRCVSRGLPSHELEAVACRCGHCQAED